jgi:hypothetical protein
MTKKAPDSSWYRSLVLVLTATIALSVAACGSSKHTATVGIGSSFVAKANAICAKAVAKHDGHPFPVPNFDPLHPSARDLPAVGRYFAQYGDAATNTTARLDALAAPPRQHADWEKLRALIDEAAANAQRQIAAAERSDIAGFEQTVTTARSLAKQINEIGPRLGFTSSSACSKVFG